MYAFKKDDYRKSRGGTSRVLDVRCDHCTGHIAFYQKDGPGPLKRMYVDRFIDILPSDENLICSDCKRIVGIRYTYENEARPAYRLFAGAVTKKIISRRRIQ